LRHGDIASFRVTVTDAMNANTLDAVVYPTAAPYATIGNNLRFSPNTGLPALSLPMGEAAGTENFAGIGGANLGLVGRSYSEPTLIAMGYAYEQATRHQTTPALYGALPGDVFAGPGADDDVPGDGAVTVTRSAAGAAKGQTFTVTVSQDAADLFAYTLTVGYDPKSFTLVGTDVNGRGVSDTATKRVDRPRHCRLDGRRGAGRVRAWAKPLVTVRRIR
jgi:hypothetical protein